MKLVLIIVFLLNALTSFAEHCCGHPISLGDSSSSSSEHPCCPESQVTDSNSKSDTAQDAVYRDSFCGHSCCVSFHPAPPAYFLTLSSNSHRAVDSFFFSQKDLYQPVPTPPPNIV